MSTHEGRVPGHCHEYVYGTTWGSGHWCNRPRKDDPDNPDDLCGLHLSAKRRRAAKVEEIRARLRSQTEILDRVNDQIAQLERLGVTAVVDYAGRGYTGKVIVDPEELLAVLGELDLMTDLSKLSD